MLSEKSAPNSNTDSWGFVKPPQPRTDKVHGGQVVEEVTTPEKMNDPTCEHVWEIDPTETEFVAYMCTKPNCGNVVLYDK